MRDFWSAFSGTHLVWMKGYDRLAQALSRVQSQKIPQEIYSSKKKLNLGSSDRTLPGYVNVDALPERNPDIVSDVTKLDFAKDDEYDLVRVSHILEHFSLEEAPEVLKEWRRVLRPGGYLVVCVPNYKAISWRTVIKPSGLDLDAETYKNGWINGIYALDLPDEYRHKIVFTCRSLTGLLESNGFKIADRLSFRKEEPWTLGIRDDSCSPYSLNLAAIKV